MPLLKTLIIAIDGYSSCGKSTFAKAIARKLDYIYIDTGAMYRAVTWFALQNGYITNGILDENGLSEAVQQIKVSFARNKEKNSIEVLLNGENVEQQIRGIEVANYVSLVSRLKKVREHMVSLQREMGKQKGIVMDGRDIGTVVYPDAEIKIFMTASPDVRAQRRYNELINKGQTVSFEEIKANLIERDRLDSTRAESPLKQAEGALILDNSNMTPEQQMDWFVSVYKKLNL